MRGNCNNQEPSSTHIKNQEMKYHKLLKCISVSMLSTVIEVSYYIIDIPSRMLHNKTNGMKLMKDFMDKYNTDVVCTQYYDQC